MKESTDAERSCLHCNVKMFHSSCFDESLSLCRSCVNKYEEFKKSNFLKPVQTKLVDSRLQDYFSLTKKTKDQLFSFETSKLMKGKSILPNTLMEKDRVNDGPFAQS